MVRDMSRFNTRHCIFIITFLLLVVAVLTGITVGMLIIRPKPTYFATTETGKTIQLIGLPTPNLSNKAILQWATMAAISAFTYNYVNFNQVFAENKAYFTVAGWKSFSKSLDAAGISTSIKEKKLIVQAVLAGPSVIKSQYELHGKTTWNIQIPLLVTFESMSELNEQKYMVTLTVRRISTLANLHGMGISQFLVEQM